MPVKTGASHGIGAFVGLIAGTMLSKYLWELAPPIGELSLTVIRAIQSTTGLGIPTDEQFAGTVVVMVGLTSVWGLVYHFGRHG